MTASNGKQTDDSKAANQAQQFADKLHRICRARSRLMVCFYTLPLYVVALVLLLNEGRGVTSFMFIYMAVYAFFAIDMVLRECPRCGQQFFVKGIFLNFITSRCVHCGLSCRVDRGTGASEKGRHF